MSVFSPTKKPAGDDWHRADIVAALHKQGWSLRKLSEQHGLGAGTLKSALDRPYPKAEKIIAAAVGLPPEEIWPKRYARRNFTPVLTPVALSTSARSRQTVAEAA